MFSQHQLTLKFMNLKASKFHKVITNMIVGKLKTSRNVHA